jgi:hypothetical protein
MRIFAFRFWRGFRKKPKLCLPPLKVVLYKRKECHLCESTLELVRKFRDFYHLEIEERDIDADPALVRQMGERVPVVYVQGRERFFGQISEVLLRRTLAAERRLLDKS